MKNPLICVPLVLLGALPALGDADDVVTMSKVAGGVVVHLGCADGQRTVELHRNDGYCVHGLDVDAANIEKARVRIRKSTVYGKVAVDTFDGVHLPCVDNMVNLIIVDHLGDVSHKELMRVLAPRGVAMIKKDGAWSTAYR